MDFTQKCTHSRNHSSENLSRKVLPIQDAKKQQKEYYYSFRRLLKTSRYLKFFYFTNLPSVCHFATSFRIGCICVFYMFKELFIFIVHVKCPIFYPVGYFLPGYFVTTRSNQYCHIGKLFLLIVKINPIKS